MAALGCQKRDVVSTPGGNFFNQGLFIIQDNFGFLGGYAKTVPVQAQNVEFSLFSFHVTCYTLQNCHLFTVHIFLSDKASIFRTEAFLP